MGSNPSKPGPEAPALEACFFCRKPVDPAKQRERCPHCHRDPHVSDPIYRDKDLEKLRRAIKKMEKRKV